MISGKGLGAAAGALLLLGIQIVAPVPAAAQDNAAGAATPDQPTYYERRTTPRTGNIYGAHGVIGHTRTPRRGYYAASRAPRSYVHHRSYRAQPRVAHGYYGATRRYPRYYARPYPASPAAAPGYASPGFPQYYAQPYAAPALPGAPQYQGQTVYAPQYYAPRSYPAAPAPYAAPATVVPAPSTNPLSSLFGSATNWSSACVNGRACVGGVYYRGGVPVCRTWAACNY